jgi:uncharacterized protein YndB with AHSA1/START domain
VIRNLVRLAVVAAAGGWLVDRWLARWAGGDAPGVPIRTHVVIDAPIERVWAVLADIPSQPTWMHDLKKATILGDGPVGVGTRADGLVRIAGISVRDPIEIIAFDPPRRYAVRHDGRYAGQGVIELTPGADGTTTIVDWTEILVPPILPHLGARLQAPFLAAVFQADLHRLRRLVETGSVDGMAA